MAEPVSTPGLQIDEDLAFHERFRKVQLVVWVLATGILVAALLGLLGVGVLSRAVAGDTEEGLKLHYQRFARYRSPTSVQVEITVADPAATQVEFWVERSVLEQYVVDSVSPEPESVETDGDRLVYTFAVTPGTTTELRATMRVQPDEFGFIPLRLGTGDAQTIDVTQIVYP